MQAFALGSECPPWLGGLALESSFHGKELVEHTGVMVVAGLNAQAVVESPCRLSHEIGWRRKAQELKISRHGLAHIGQIGKFERNGGW